MLYQQTRAAVFEQSLFGTSSMFSFAFWGLVSTIGGREGELAHNLICRHSAIVLPFGTDVRCLRQPSHVSYHPLQRGNGGEVETLLQPLYWHPFSRANALIRALHAYNTYVRMKEPQCWHRHVCILYSYLTLRLVKQTFSLSPFVFHFLSPYSLPTTLAASRIEVRTRFSHYVGDLPSFGHLAIT